MFFYGFLLRKCQERKEKKTILLLLSSFFKKIKELRTHKIHVKKTQSQTKKKHREKAVN